jgi:hypothetical protein
MSAKAISPAKTTGLRSGSVWQSVRKRILRVLCAAAENSASGFAEMLNSWKK